MPKKKKKWLYNLRVHSLTHTVTASSKVKTEIHTLVSSRPNKTETWASSNREGKNYRQFFCCFIFVVNNVLIKLIQSLSVVILMHNYLPLQIRAAFTPFSSFSFFLVNIWIISSLQVCHFVGSFSEREWFSSNLLN